MACFAPNARANCVTALPIDPPIAGARTVLPARKPARVSATCAVRYATGIPAALTSSTLSGIRQRSSFRTAKAADSTSHELRDGAQPISASNVDPGQLSFTRTGRKPTVTPSLRRSPLDDLTTFTFYSLECSEAGFF